MSIHPIFPPASREDANAALDGSSNRRYPSAVQKSEYGRKSLTERGFAHCGGSGSVENRKRYGARNTRLALRASVLAHDPAFAPAIPSRQYVTRQILAARSLTDRRGRHLVSFARLARWLGEDEVNVRRWHAAAAEVERPPGVPGGMGGLVVRGTIAS